MCVSVCVFGCTPLDRFDEFKMSNIKLDYILWLYGFDSLEDLENESELMNNNNKILMNHKEAILEE